LENTANGVLSSILKPYVKTEQTAFSFQANYFTKLIELKLENKAIYQTPSIGSNRQNSIGDRLTINEKGIQGFNSAVYGNKKIHNDSTDSRICT
jgi:hypothetical protein